MRRFLFVGRVALVVAGFGVMSGGIATAQSAATGDDGSPVHNSAVHKPSTNVDSGIQAKGVPGQQSPAPNTTSNTNGATTHLPQSSKPSDQAKSDAPGSSHNALTESPKGPGTGGNDATK